MKWFRFPRVLGVVAVVYLLAVAVLFARLSMENRSFLANADSTQGTVVALVPRTFSGGERGPGLHRNRGVPLAPEIRFTVNGQSYTYTPVNGRYKPNVRIGDQVTILYSPDDPASTARLAGEGRVVIPVITIGFALLAVALVVVLVRTRKLGAPPPAQQQHQAGRRPPQPELPRAS
ncbi:hypothetical protein FHX74_001208 [Friedmanniella endophytica]|uniref:DUF3592 domain-containing protein n=1 Tax=Microlunatus kandeliicorticis TaxID=1759536 RepID=A0A7W3P556_9ACTN|nr:DUF3592 domain-containing protein [Microlunatus kandeliicorticis]MBA8793603.1 hypothetical protein [Microlunatus kandeliicorticis]